MFARKNHLDRIIIHFFNFYNFLLYLIFVFLHLFIKFFHQKFSFFKFWFFSLFKIWKAYHLNAVKLIHRLAHRTLILIVICVCVEFLIFLFEFWNIFYHILFKCLFLKFDLVNIALYNNAMISVLAI
jgi:hypothetical protein